MMNESFAGHNPDVAPESVLDGQLFFRALDTLEQGIAFNDRSGTLVHANRAFRRGLEERGDGLLSLELGVVARSVAALAAVRGMDAGETTATGRRSSGRAI
jgi:hypothetical protein